VKLIVSAVIQLTTPVHTVVLVSVNPADLDRCRSNSRRLRRRTIEESPSVVGENDDPGGQSPWRRIVLGALGGALNRSADNQFCPKRKISIVDEFLVLYRARAVTG
jgi:hypothetical protein